MASERRRWGGRNPAFGGGRSGGTPRRQQAVRAATLYAGLAFGAAALVRALHHVALTSSGGTWVYTIVDLPYAAAWHLGQALSAAVEAVGSLPAAARAAAATLAGALVAGALLLPYRSRRRGSPR